jgi:hypothetical protein
MKFVRLNLTVETDTTFLRALLITFSILVLVYPSESSAQKHTVDAIYLSNGEVFRGSIQETLDPDKLCLETLCLNTRLFSKDEISRIEQEKINYQAFRYGKESSVRGYFNRTDLGLLIGSGNNSGNVVFSLQMVNGYKLGRRYYPGIGTGLEFYDYAVVPVFADFTYAITESRVGPFLRGSIGYSIPIEEPREQWGTLTKNKGGILLAAGVGTSIRTGSSSALTLSLVYRFQSLKSVYEEEWTDDVLNLERQLNRIALRIGFLFD